MFGGPRNRSLGIAYRVGTRARVSVVVRRGKKVVRRFRTRTERPGETVRLRLASREAPPRPPPRDDHGAPGARRDARASLYAQRL